MPDMTPLTTLSLTQFAEQRGVSAKTVRKWITAGMPHLRTSLTFGHYLIPVDEADAWLRDFIVSARRSGIPHLGVRVSVMSRPSYSHNSQAPSDPTKTSLAAKPPQAKVVRLTEGGSTNLPKTSV
jgi:hypothetical protein